MNDTLHHRMLDATRRTRAGRLADATAFLQRVLRGDREPDRPDMAADTADGPALRVPPGIPDGGA